MLGPVFYLEMLLGSRRGRLDLLRRVYAAFLAVEFICFFANFLTELAISSIISLPDDLGRDPLGRFVNTYLSLFVLQHFLLLLLLTPVFAAGAITDEKMTGSLQYLLTADLTSWEIVFGKLLGRSAQVALIAIAGLPLVAFMGAYGDLHWFTIVTLAMVSVAPLLALGAVSMLVSVWCRQTRDAVLCVYALFIAGVIFVCGLHESVPMSAPASRSSFDLTLYHLDGVLQCLDPLHVLEPAWEKHDVKTTAGRLLTALLAWGGLGSVSLSLAVWRMRPVYLRQLTNPEQMKFGASSQTLQVDEDDPIAWKERNFEVLTHLPWSRRIPRWLPLVTIGATTLFLVGKEWIIPYTLIVLIFSSLLAGIRASSLVCGERERKTWELLLLTPLETLELLKGKHRGIVHSTTPYLFAHAVPALFLALNLGIGSILAIIVMIALSWLAMYFMAAVGIWCSALSESSWRSLLWTLTMGFCSGSLIFFEFCIRNVIIVILFPIFVLWFRSDTSDAALISLLGVVSTLAFLMIAIFEAYMKAKDNLLRQAENWIARHERTRPTPPNPFLYKLYVQEQAFEPK